jgi:hypothetical protein
MVWSLLYGLTRNTLSMMVLRVRGDAAKDIEFHRAPALALGLAPPGASPALERR